MSPKSFHPNYKEIQISIAIVCYCCQKVMKKKLYGEQKKEKYVWGWAELQRRELVSWWFWRSKEGGLRLLMVVHDCQRVLSMVDWSLWCDYGCSVVYNGGSFMVGMVVGGFCVRLRGGLYGGRMKVLISVWWMEGGKVKGWIEGQWRWRVSMSYSGWRLVKLWG